MKIAVYSFKGGVGKTAISVNCCLTTGAALITNDYHNTIIESVIPLQRLLKLKPGEDFPDIPDDVDVVYDLGGYVDPRVVKPLTTVDWVLIPVENTKEALQAAIHTVAEVRVYNQEIIIIANKLKRSGLENIQKIIWETTTPRDDDGQQIMAKRLPILPLKSTTAFEHVTDKSKSLQQLVDAKGILAYHFKEPSQQFEQILNCIRCTKP